MKDKVEEAEKTGRAFRLGCTYDPRERGEGGRKVAALEKSQIAVV